MAGSPVRYWTPAAAPVNTPSTWRSADTTYSASTSHRRRSPGRRSRREHWGVPAKFEVADVMDLSGPPRFDTIVDSALFHVFGQREERLRYAANLHAVCRPGGRVYVLALSDAGPGLGPPIPDDYIRGAFTDGWRLLDLQE